MNRMFYRWEKIEGGVRKHYEWGHAEVRQPNTEDCFTKEELTHLILELTQLKNVGATTPEEDDLLGKCKAKRKGRA